MSKEKLFTPEDFDKDSGHSKKNAVKWIVGATLLIIAIIALIFALKGCDSNTESNSVNETNSKTEVAGDSIADTTNIEEVSVKGGNIEQGIEVPSKSEERMNDALQETKTNTNTEQVSVQSYPAVSSDVEAEALKVIRGDYGNSPERKTALGDKYQSIQNRVNQLKRQGVF